MSKFTRGPWQLDKRIGCVFDSDGHPILSGGEYCGDDEAFANAQLIASSPEMYEALKFAVNALYGADAHLADDGTETQDYLKMKAAIAKAEGK